MDSLINEMDADGFNGDTMGFVLEEFYSVSVALNHSVAIEPEGGGNVVNSDQKTGKMAANWDTMGWVRCAVFDRKLHPRGMPLVPTPLIRVEQAGV
jgi:hypothetical protein